MATTTKGLPAWVQVSKEDLSKTEEWETFTSELYDAVQQQLTESHVSYFSDLTDSEKILFLDRAAKLVRDGSAHRSFLKKVSGMVDLNLNEDVTQKLMDPVNSNTKTEMLLSEASVACVTLLQRWPDLKSKLYACLNRPLPCQLRKAMWKLLLGNRKIRLEYFQKVSTRAKDCVFTSHDAAIDHSCYAYLSSDSLGLQQLSSKPEIMCVMKTALSYRDAVMKSTSTLVDTDYLLAIPFLKVLIGDPAVNDVDAEEIAGFIELYFTFMESRPLFMKDSGSKEFYAALKQFGTTMATILQSIDRQLATALQKSCSEGKVQGEAVQLADCLANLMRPYVRCLFVGFLPLDVVCYIWDQVLLSCVKLSKLHCIATFSVVMLVLVKRHLILCRNVNEVRDIIHEHCKDLKLREFQTEIDNNFLSEWQKAVTEEVHGSELPLVDPVATLGTTAPWSGWFSEKPLSRQRPEDRRLTREAREEQRRRLEEEQVREGRRRKREEEEVQRGREADMKRELEQEQWRERKSLEDQLAAERTARVQSERNMAKEIRRLEAALARFGVSSGPSSGGGSASLPRTPVTPQGPSFVTPVPDSPRTDAMDIVKSLLGRTTRALEILISGNDEQRRDLGQIARNAVDTNGQDFHDAQRELFGQELSAEDWDEMSPEERQENLDKFVERIKQKREERRGENGTN